MQDSTALSVTKPVKIWEKTVDVDFKKIFTAFGKAGISYLKGDIFTIGRDAIDLIGAFKFVDEPDQVAYILIKSSLINAAHNLLDESRHLLRSPFEELEKLYDDPDYVRFLDEVDTILGEKELKINLVELKNPRSISIVSDFQPFLRKWLTFFEVSECQAENLVRRFPAYFVLALVDEWRQNPGKYKLISERLDTPATPAAKRELDWNRYRHWLQKQAQEPVFEEAFGLQDIYVSLRAFYEEKKKENDTQEVLAENRGRHNNTGYLKVPVWVHEELDSWIDNCSRDQAIRVITGGPGSGKSTLAKIWAAEKAAQNHRILFIPLHLFDVKDDLVEAIQEFTDKSSLSLDHNPLRSLKEDNTALLIIFDGLDELSKQGAYGQEIAQQFIKEVERTCRLYNQSTVMLKVLITGREVAVQVFQSDFRKRGQILYLLPYLITLSESEEKIEEEYKDNLEILTIDQRQAWWKRYSNVSEKLDFAGLPDELQNKKLDEITAQPLLNYLVALTYQRGKVIFSEGTNLNQIYRDLIESVHQRGYEQNREHRSVEGMEIKDFLRILEEIAVAAWHGGDGRTTTIGKIQSYIEKNQLGRLLERFQDGAKKGVTRLLTAFYFRQQGVEAFTGVKTFEFTHKSFGEYLAASRIVGMLEKIDQNYRLYHKDFDSGWAMEVCLQKWLNLTGSQAISTYLFSFIEDEIKLRETNAPGWQETLILLINHVLRKGIPMGEPRRSHMEETEMARNTEEAMLACLFACAKTVGKVSDINWPERDSAARWLGRLEPIGDSLANQCLSYMDFSRQQMHSLSSHFTNFYQSKFNHTDFTFSILLYANWQSAHFQGARLRYAKLLGANLVEADLRGADLRGADLRDADFRGADFRGADLSRANLEGVNLEGADLEGAIGLPKD